MELKIFSRKEMWTTNLWRTMCRDREALPSVTTRDGKGYLFVTSLLERGLRELWVDQIDKVSLVRT